MTDVRVPVSSGPVTEEAAAEAIPAGSGWRPPGSSRTVIVILSLVALAGVLAVLAAWRLPPFTTAYEATDNAYVRGRTTVISPQVSGYVTRVLVRDFADVAGAGTVDAKVADAALNRLEVDALGLDAMDRRYLMMIADIYRGGPVGVETLAAGLSEPRDTIEEVIEPYLIQLGLVARTARGRCLNAGGWKHLGLNPPAGSQDGLFD